MLLINWLNTAQKFRRFGRGSPIKRGKDSNATPLAQNNLGYIYANGFGTPKDIINAMLYLHKAADKGQGDALNSLAYLYQYVLNNNEKAIKYYKLGVKQGSASVQYGLGTYYASVCIDNPMAEKYFSLSAKQGFAPAQQLVAKINAIKNVIAAQKVFIPSKTESLTK